MRPSLIWVAGATAGTGVLAFIGGWVGSWMWSWTQEKVRKAVRDTIEDEMTHAAAEGALVKLLLTTTSEAKEEGAELMEEPPKPTPLTNALDLVLNHLLQSVINNPQHQENLQKVMIKLLTRPDQEPAPCLALATDRFLQEEITSLLSNEEHLARLTHWLNQYLAHPETAASLVKFLDQFWQAPGNQETILALVQQVSTHPELIQYAANYLGAVFQHPTVLQSVQDGLTTAASNGLQTEQFHEAGAQSIWDVVTCILVPSFLRQKVTELPKELADVDPEGLTLEDAKGKGVVEGEAEGSALEDLRAVPSS